MAKTAYPPERRRVKIHGRVSPKTYEKLQALGQENVGRAVDALADMVSLNNIARHIRRGVKRSAAA